MIVRGESGWGDGWLGFPPGRSFVVLPARPRRAAREGLALYDAVALRQQAYLAVGRLLVGARLGTLLDLRVGAPFPDRAWWNGWVGDVVVPRVGPVATAAFRLLGGPSGEPGRFTCLFFDGAGAPVAFGKAWRSDGADRPGGEVAEVIDLLGAEPPLTFGVPRLLQAGQHDGRAYLLQEPLPTGGHRRMAPDPERLRAVIAELQARLSGPPPPGPGSFPTHGSLTPLNLRQDRHGDLWLLDWDKVSWGPRRYDEVRYWMSDVARRHRGSARRKAARVLRLLRGGGSMGEVRAALDWRVRVRPREVLPSEQELRDGLFELLRDS